MSKRTILGFTAYTGEAGGNGVPLLAKGAAGEIFLAGPDGTLTETAVQAYRLTDGLALTPFANIHGYVEDFTVDIGEGETAPGIWFVSGKVKTFRPFLEGQQGRPGLPGTNGVATDEAVATNLATPGTGTRTEATALVTSIIHPIWDATTRDVIADTGSQTRTLLNALYGGDGGSGLAAGFVSVLEYGAVGDGVADDSATVQAALDDNAGTVVFPPGYTFRLFTRIRFSANMHVMAYGATIIRDESCVHMVRNYRESSIDGVDDIFPGYSGNGNILVEGGTWDCNAKNVPGGNTFTLAHAANLTFKNMTCIRNRDHVFDLPGCDGVLIENVWMLGFNVSATHKEAIQVDSCIPLAASMQPKDGTITKNLTVRDCRVGPYKGESAADDMPTCGRFVGSHSVSTLGIPFENIRVLDNTVDGAQSRGISAYGWTGFNIAGNDIRETASTCITVTTPAGISCTSGMVQGNEVRDNKTNFAIVVASEGAAAELRNIKMLDNTSQNSSNAGIVIGVSTGCVVGNNHVRGAAVDNPGTRWSYAFGAGSVDGFMFLNTATKSGAMEEASAGLYVSPSAVRPRYVLNNLLDGLTVDDQNSGSITT